MCVQPTDLVIRDRPSKIECYTFALDKFEPALIAVLDPDFSALMILTLAWGSATWATGATTIRVRDATSRIVGSSSVDIVCSGSGGVDTESNPTKQTILDSIAQQNILNKRVRSGRLLQENAILSIGSQRLGVNRVSLRGLNLGDEALVKEDLADVRSGEVEDGAVGVGGGVEVDEDVDVWGAADVVTRDEGLEEGDTVVVGLLDAAEESGVEVGGVGGGVAIAAGGDAGVDTGRVAVYVHRNVSVGDLIKSIDEENVRQISV